MAVATPACRRCARAQALAKSYHPHSLLSPCQPCACSHVHPIPSILWLHAALYIYAFIVKALSLRNGGWVRMGAYWQTEEDPVLLPILHPIGPARSNVHKSDKHGHPPPPLHPIGCCCPCVHTHARASIIQAWRLMRDSLIPEHHEIPSYIYICDCRRII